MRASKWTRLHDGCRPPRSFLPVDFGAAQGWRAPHGTATSSTIPVRTHLSRWCARGRCRSPYHRPERGGPSFANDRDGFSGRALRRRFRGACGGGGGSGWSVSSALVASEPCGGACARTSHGGPDVDGTSGPLLAASEQSVPRVSSVPSPRLARHRATRARSLRWKPTGFSAIVSATPKAALTSLGTKVFADQLRRRRLLPGFSRWRPFRGRFPVERSACRVLEK